MGVSQHDFINVPKTEPTKGQRWSTSPGLKRKVMSEGFTITSHYDMQYLACASNVQMHSHTTDHFNPELLKM